MNHCDFLIIGGGVIGINIARHLLEKNHQAKIIILEKEKKLGSHASGRNSGVLHAGFYYHADSLKAKFTRDGNRALTKFCEEKSLKINKCGKLIVAKDEKDLDSFTTLLERAKLNNVDLQKIDKASAKEIEPNVKTFKSALWSPNTSSVDPVEVLLAMRDEVIFQGVEIRYEEEYKSSKNNLVQTNKNSYQAGFIINAAGLYADKIAKDFGFGKNYYLMPFKGLYLYSDGLETNPVKTNIYPVPDLKNPFLGTHLTVAVDGKVKLGPTAIPGFWREQYDFKSNFNIKEFLETTYRQINLFTDKRFGLRSLIFQEMPKYFSSVLVKQASFLAEGVDKKHYKIWGKPGIRAQLVNKKEHKLEMDFVLEGDDKSIHVLNAVSPAFTCSIPFSKNIVDQIKL